MNELYADLLVTPKRKREWLRVGDKVRYKTWPLNKARASREGEGIITRVFLPLGNCPITYDVDTYKWGVLFPHELRKA